MGYKTCPYCGANLDPDERCDCRDEDDEKRTEPAGRNQTDSEYAHQYYNTEKENRNGK